MKYSDYSTETFEAKYTYRGADLGAVWTKEKTAFRVWAPAADRVQVRLYRSGTPGADDLIETLPMVPGGNGTWVTERYGDLNGVYYTYAASVGGALREACDPYARAVGVNGQRAMVIDLRATDPAGWETDCDPHAGRPITDAILYELHIRDLSCDPDSGIQNKGKFLGLIETGTTNAAGMPTGMDHIKALGVTHLHLLPIFDFGSVDESDLNNVQFNWGYDPVNFNVPEGSYSTNPFDGAVRVAELKQAIKGLHDNGISVVMDVAYNHVHDAEQFCFNRLVPGYFTRVCDEGAYSNGSGCGNDTASERSMVRKYIVDSVNYWADEYHIDGFRFDLVGLIDVETIREIMQTVHAAHPNVIFYGEGWSMPTGVTRSGCALTTQYNSGLVPGFAFFSDTLRDLLKGSVFDAYATGFVSGASGCEGLLQKCFAGLPDWCRSPAQSVNYVSCHDDYTLFDRLTLSRPDASSEDRIRMNLLAAAVCLTAQGVPFLHAGEELLRSKPRADGTLEHNSYQSPDSVNSLKWGSLNDPVHRRVFSYYKGLIAFRKAHPALRLTTADAVRAAVTAAIGLEPHAAAFRIDTPEENLFVIFNANHTAITVPLPAGQWAVYVRDTSAGTDVLDTVTQQAEIPAISAMVLVRR
ncbi:MAG: type I pullulanase [Butyricicoccus sp.]